MFFKNKHSINNIRNHIVGVDTKVPLGNGKKSIYINFDNAASTPSLSPVLDKVNEFLEVYSSIHRGTGYKSLLSTDAYEESREIVADFVNCDKSKNTIIFTKNTTESINKLSYRLNLSPNDIVIITEMEHHSNDLPWRNKANVVTVDLLDDGTLNLDDLELKLKAYRGRVKLVSVTGCSNVTGYINDIHYISSLAHKYGAEILVDAAQLIPHRKINMSGSKSDDFIDYLAFSSHKMYAPFGTGVLIGPKSTFEKGDPEYVGGGNVLAVSRNSVYWSDPPEKDEAGTPNVIGAVALAESIKILKEVGLNNIKNHEKELLNHMFKSLESINGLDLYSSKNKKVRDSMVAVIPFNLKGFHHSFLANLLSSEGGIGVRNGCFCAHPYVHSLLKLTPSQISELQRDILFGRLHKVPGLVRVSFGMYNTKKEVNSFIKTLKHITENKKELEREYKHLKEFQLV
ncbi:cysteine desulfurase Csd [Gottschalkia acidurici 9a]|uniref:Cysteine desulfurase Csd n=1 Tax=Gottschalkia acidurici (strain ATCC 7906 / DSM 604 / BCRC 14475 / CIP 104303 / KCTC 5404 / NCIMB 10678 / 9a) TaxID=1128398 RepID=K0AZ67_GOTA9|nr:aminotransferase class V-fold PLP-dependent enzyme [Gottschalkia acidurici]AFS78087.1 cysteine desulfurase Csd [Gottschalkia acidurici 9a]